MVQPNGKPDASAEKSHGLSRRGFLKTTGMALAASTTGLVVATQTGCTNSQPQTGFVFLRPQDIPTLGAILPAILGLPADTPAAAIANNLHQLDQRAAALSAYSQNELLLLLNLLDMAAPRWFLTGSSKAIENQSTQAIQAFLSDWRDSSLALKRKAYLAVTRLPQITWYSDLANTTHTGYPGPNAVIIRD